MIDGFVSGLISGLVVTAFVVIARAFWQHILVPWFEELVYKDAMLEGKWFSLYPSSDYLRQETVNLKRHGHNVSGAFICSCGPDEGKSYSVRGSFRNMILPLIYETDDRSRTDRGTITLRCVRDGERLEGRVAFYSTAEGSIESTSVIWFRSKKDLEHVLEPIMKQRSELEELRKKQAEEKTDSAKLIEAQDGVKQTTNITPASPKSDVNAEIKDAIIPKQEPKSK